MLDSFPNQNEIYKAIHDKICNNPNLKNWYLTTYNAQTDRAHLWFIQHKLITRKNDLGPRESWPIYYQNIFSLYLFQIEIRNGGISQYFDNSSSEDLPNLLKALKSCNLDDIIPIVLEAKSLHDKFEQLKQKYNLSDPQDFIKVDELLRQPLAEFESKIDVDELYDKIDSAMLKLAKENDILPQ